MPETCANFIGGVWKPSASGATFENENPSRRGSVLGHFQASTAGDVLEAVSAAGGACRAWRQTPLAARQEHVAEFLRLLGNARDDLARIITLENGKTLRESRAEIESALVEGAHHLHQVSAFYGHAGASMGRAMTTWVHYQPVGIVGVISPWNFPANVMCRKTIPALLTGNTVVFKPASFTPWSGVFMARLFEQAGLPRGVFNCVTGVGASAGDALVQDARVRAVSFTGSTAVGKAIQAKAAVHLTRTQLELGGKNATIVMDDADLAGALDAVLTAGFSNAGQWCTSTSRVLLHRAIAGPFVEELVDRCERMVVGDGMSEGTDMGPVAGASQHREIAAAIRRAQAEGARVVAGLGGVPAEGYFVRPTVLTGVTPAMEVFRDEIFGPVLAISEFGSLDEALALANDSPYGLSSAIFTRDISSATAYIDAIDAGLAHVNVHTGYKEPSMPFGGLKHSGAGLPENSETGLEFFVDRKAVYLRG